MPDDMPRTSPEPGSNEPAEPATGDPFHFRFSLGKPSDPPLHDKAVPEAFRRVLEAVLEVAVLTHRDTDVQVDGFRFIPSPEIYRIFSD